MSDLLDFLGTFQKLHVSLGKDKESSISAGCKKKTDVANDGGSLEITRFAGRTEESCKQTSNHFLFFLCLLGSSTFARFAACYDCVNVGALTLAILPVFPTTDRRTDGWR